MLVQKILKLKYFLLLIMIGIILMYCPSYGKKSSMTLPGQMENSPQYQNGKFHNAERDLYDVGAAWRAAFKYMLLGKRVDPVPQEPPPIQRLDGKAFYIQDEHALRFARLGHSTVMLQIGEKVWLTDPVFSERVSMFQWVGPKRFHPVPIKIEDLPPIEGVLISHNHFDHLDHDTIIKLKDRVKFFLVPLGVGDTLLSWGVPLEKITELDWWGKIQIGNIELISTPAQHFSGRGLFDSGKTLWTSWVIKTPQRSVYFSGDSGYFEGLQKIGENYGPFDLTFLDCGAYHNSWRAMHMMPEDNLKAFKDLKGKVLVPIHNSTFDLSSHPWYDPMEQIMALAPKAQVRFLIPMMGQIVDADNIPESVEWWNQQK